MYLLENGHYRKMQLLALGMLEKYLQECELSREESLYWNIRGLLQLYLGRYGDSRGSFSKAASFDGENGTTSLGLAQCLLGKRLFEEAERACRTLQQSHDTTKMASFLLSDLYLTKGFLTRPLSVLEEALQRSPDSPLLLMRKAYVLFVLKKTREFAGFHHEIYPLCSKSFYMKLLRSLSLVDSQKIDDAVFELSSLMASNRHHIIVLKSLGFLSLQSQDLIKAMSIFDSILEFYPVDFELYLGKGMVYYLMKDYRSAFECFQRALELNPLDSGLWQCLGALYYHLEKYDESERCWDRGLRYCRSMAQPLTNRGIYLSRRGRHLEALECIEKALRLEPENHRLLLIKANCQAHLSSPEDAVGTVEKVLTLQPQSLQGWILRATLEFSQKNYEVSFQSYDKAVQLDNRNALLWYNRALVAMFMNNRLEARRSLERTLVINPDFFEALLAQYILDGLMGFNRELELTGARLKAVNPERFQAWQRRFRETEDPLHALKPLEVSECDFELPVLMPLYHIRQVEVFDFLFNQNME
jgi:superkiller protein 3